MYTFIREVYTIHVCITAHSDRGCVIYSGLDLQTGDILAVTEWKVNICDHYDINHCLKQVNSSEQEFTYLSKLRHSNLVRYLNMKYIHEKEQIIIYVLQEFVLGTLYFTAIEL